MFRVDPAKKLVKMVGSWLKSWCFRCCRIAYQRNDDDEEEAARERRRRARQERLRQKQEEEALGQVTDQVEVNTQNRYCPLWKGTFLSCFLASLMKEMCWAKHSLLSPTQSLSLFLACLILVWPLLATHQTGQLI